MPWARRVFALLGVLIGPLTPAGARADMIYVTQWGGYGFGIGQFNYPTGIALAPNGGGVYVSDGGNNRITRYERDGQYVGAVAAYGTAPGQVWGPDHLTFSPTNGDLYVTDRNNNRVQRFTPEGEFVLAWGSLGPGPGQFGAPWGIHVDANGDVFVVSRDQQRVQKFTENGDFLMEWGTAGTGPGQFQKPHGVLTDAEGNIYVSDVMRHDVQRFDASGAYLLEWGGPGSEPGLFLHPYHLSLVHGSVVTVDWLEHPHGGRLQEFTTSGALSRVIIAGQQGTAPLQFHTIYQAAYDGFGTWYVIEWGNHRVQVFREPTVAAESLDSSASVGRVSVVPNPTRGSVRVRFELSRPEAVRATVYDVAGRSVRVLDSGFLPEGPHELAWDGLDHSGSAARPGVYLVHVVGRWGASSVRVAIVR